MNKITFHRFLILLSQNCNRRPPPLPLYKMKRNKKIHLGDKETLLLNNVCFEIRLTCYRSQNALDKVNFLQSRGNNSSLESLECC